MFWPWITAGAAGRAVVAGYQQDNLADIDCQDRRLGDYFEINLEQAGCLLIATGDTRLSDPARAGPLPTARPLCVRQNAGPSLTGRGDCA